MQQLPERAHWINVIVGILDASFYLSEEEQFAVSDIVRRLFLKLHIPERAMPGELPIPLVQELHSGLYSVQLEAPRTSGLARPVRHVSGGDSVTSLEAWRLSFENMILTAYPDLAVEERLLLRKVLTDLLAAIGVPDRAAASFPDAVIEAHQRLDSELA